MIAEQIAQLLDSWGLVDYRPTSLGGDCFVDSLPETPDEVVAVFTSGGAQPGPVVEQPRFQVRVRGSRDGDPVPAYERVAAIGERLHGFRGALPGGLFLLSCWRVNADPLPMGADDHGRIEFSTNFVVEMATRTVTV